MIVPGGPTGHGWAIDRTHWPRRRNRPSEGSHSAWRNTNRYRISVMFQSVHASHNQRLYFPRLGSVTDIANLVCEHRMDTITSAERQIVFWFTVHQPMRIVNRPAVEMLIATTGFSARDVPLIRGNVVITGSSGDGGPANLNDEQVRSLANLETRGKAAWILEWRFVRDLRESRRQSRARSTALQSAWRLA